VHVMNASASSRHHLLHICPSKRRKTSWAGKARSAFYTTSNILHSAILWPSLHYDLQAKHRCGEYKMSWGLSWNAVPVLISQCDLPVSKNGSGLCFQLHHALATGNLSLSEQKALIPSIGVQVPLSEPFEYGINILPESVLEVALNKIDGAFTTAASWMIPIENRNKNMFTTRVHTWMLTFLHGFLLPPSPEKNIERLYLLI